jgi:hypothetical protein
MAIKKKATAKGKTPAVKREKKTAKDPAGHELSAETPQAVPAVPHVVEQGVMIEPYPAPAASSAANAWAPADEYDVPRVFQNAWAYFKNAFPVNFLASLATALAIVPVFFTFFSMMADRTKMAVPNIGRIFLLEIFYFIILWYAVAFMITVFNRRGLGKNWDKPGIAPIFAASFMGALRMIVLMLIFIGCIILIMLPFGLIAVFASKTAAVTALVIEIIAYLAILVLMVYLMLIFGPSMVITVIEPKIIEALRESARITKGKRLKILLTYFLAMLIVFGAEIVIIIPAAIIAAFAVKAAAAATALFLVAGFILLVLFMAVVMPLGYAYYYSIYNEAKNTVK